MTAYDMDRAIPDEKLALAERIWFGDERPFSSARKAWQHLEGELERWGGHSSKPNDPLSPFQYSTSRLAISSWGGN